MTFVVLSSSKGTVLQAVLDALKKGTLTARCAGLISDNENHGCVAKAKAHGLPVTIVPMTKGEPREAFDKRVDGAIRMLAGKDQPIVACMGWMWMLSPWFVKKWRNKIVNVHPALLPKYPGTHAHDLVLKSKDTESGMSIHLIDEGMDTGKILLQKKCPVLPGDTVETLKARVQQLECEWYPKALEMMERGEMKL